MGCDKLTVIAPVMITFYKGQIMLSLSNKIYEKKSSTPTCNNIIGYNILCIDTL